MKTRMPCPVCSGYVTVEDVEHPEPDEVPEEDPTQEEAETQEMER